MNQESWLVTGGAGYIGSHIVEQLLLTNRKVIVYDSLTNGLESRIRYLERKHNVEIPLIVEDIRDQVSLNKVLNQFKPVGILHTAALKSVTDSMLRPEEYFSVNTESTSMLINLLSKNQIKRLFFSSTAAVYGSPRLPDLIKEDEEKHPISAYGISKLAAEQYVNEFLSKPGNSGTSLRFFNVVGTAAVELSDNSRENLVPILIDKFKKNESPIIFGTDYPTPDGTCIRDYIDVRDIARAHIAAINHPTNLPQALNVGTGSGISVREIINLVAHEFGIKDYSSIETQRRPGDPSQLCADISLIKKEIRFEAQFAIQESIRSLFRT